MQKILVVEDSPTQAAQLEFILRGAGYEVVAAEDAERASALLAEERFDLVVSDIVLPGASGYDLCRKVKQAEQEMPVLLVSSLSDPMTIINALECGADNFVVKPYEPEHLIARISTALSNSSLRAAASSKGGVEVMFLGKKFAIRSDREQILDLLMSTFEDIVRTNADLQRSRAELSSAKRQLERYAGQLEKSVEERTGELIRRQRQLSDAQRIAQLGDWQLDLDGGTLLWSEEMCRLCGVEPQASERTLSEAMALVHEEDRPALQEKIDAAVASSAGFTGEFRFMRPSGEERVFWVAGHPERGPAGKLVALSGIVQDVTERKKMELQVLQVEEQLYRSQKMEAIGQLTGGISHDFNNLLSIIIGNLDMAREDATDSEVLLSIQEAQEAAFRGAELNQRLLAFAKRQTLQPEPTDVNALVTSTARLLGRVLGERIELKLDLSADLPLAGIDPAQLESALTNLAINARDAIIDSGVIEISTSWRCVTGAAIESAPVAAGDYVIVEVKDNGSGIPPEILQRVCEPFFTTKETGKGSGLGLSMVSGFLEQSGGALRISSEPGKGSSFELYVPVSALGELPTEGPREPSVAMRGARGIVLAVEDDEKLRRVLLKQLRALGYEAIEAATGDAAFEIIRSDQPLDLLLTDVVMPGTLDGKQLAEAALQVRPGLRVVLSSGFPDALAGTALASSRMTLLKKPYRRGDLANALAGGP